MTRLFVSILGLFLVGIGGLVVIIDSETIAEGYASETLLSALVRLAAWSGSAHPLASATVMWFLPLFFGALILVWATRAGGLYKPKRP